MIMRRLLLIAASVVPLMTFVADGASAQVDAASGGRIGGGGFGGRGIGGGGFGGGFRQPGMAPRQFGGGFRGGMRPGFGGGAWRAGVARPGWGGGYGWRGRYAYPARYYGYGRRGYYPYAGLAAGLALGAAASYPYYGYGYGGYDYPAYPAYESYPVRAELGGYCETRVKTCTLINPSSIGAGCSCRVAGGRARGIVVGP
jgi:hypothetical protein